MAGVDGTKGQQTLGPWAAIGVFFAAYFLSYLIFRSWISLGIPPFLNRYNTANTSWELGMLLVACFVFWAFPQQFRKLSFTISILSAFAALVVGVVTANLATAIQLEVGRIQWSSHRPVTIVLAIIISPIVEELFFRGLILNAILPAWPIAVSVAVDSFLFASTHGDFWPAFVSGVILCGAFLIFRRSLFASMLTHSAMNTAVAFHSTLMLPMSFVHHP